MDLSRMDPMSSEKWCGMVKVSVEVSAEKVWKLVSDFCGLSKWMPMVTHCSRIEGEEDTSPGCLRHVVGTSVPRVDGETVSWVKERLVEFDAGNHSLTYVVEDGNVAALAGYLSTFRVSAHADDPEKSVIAWSFQMNPSPVPETSRAEAVEFVCQILERNVSHLVIAAQGTAPVDRVLEAPELLLLSQDE